MAAGIVDCNGNQIMVGDRVRTASGKVITVKGALVAEQLFNAEKCTKLEKDEKEEEWSRLPKQELNEASAGEAEAFLDCVVWGD